VLSSALLTLELAEPLSRAGIAVFVDAAVDSPRKVLLRKLEPAPSSQVMAHSASPATLLAIARDVFGHAPQAWWLTIPVTNLGIGEHLSPVAKRGAASALRKIKALQQGL
jgi:hydrogenase maturation protease